MKSQFPCMNSTKIIQCWNKHRPNVELAKWKLRKSNVFDSIFSSRLKCQKLNDFEMFIKFLKCWMFRFNFKKLCCFASLFMSKNDTQIGHMEFEQSYILFDFRHRSKSKARLNKIRLQLLYKGSISGPISISQTFLKH